MGEVGQLPSSARCLRNQHACWTARGPGATIAAATENLGVVAEADRRGDCPRRHDWHPRTSIGPLGLGIPNQAKRRPGSGRSRTAATIAEDSSGGDAEWEAEPAGERIGTCVRPRSPASPRGTPRTFFVLARLSLCCCSISRLDRSKRLSFLTAISGKRDSQLFPGYSRSSPMRFPGDSVERAILRRDITILRRITEAAGPSRCCNCSWEIQGTGVDVKASIRYNA